MCSAVDHIQDDKHMLLHAVVVVASAGSFERCGAALAGARCKCLAGGEYKYDGVTMFKW